MDSKLFAAVPGVCGGELCITGYQLKYETLQGLVVGGVSDVEIMRMYDFVTPAQLEAIRARPAKNAIRCCYCNTEIVFLPGGEYVTHTCNKLKEIRGPQAIIGVDGGAESYSRRTIGHPDDWYREQ